LAVELSLINLSSYTFIHHFGFEKDRISFEEASVQAEEWLEYLLREDSEN
jgi:hypothetical protein